MRRKKCTKLETQPRGWIFVNDPWKPPKTSSQYSHYYFASPNYYPRDNPVLNHHHDYLDRKSPRQYEQISQNRMANVVPWILSMSLLGLQEYGGHSAGNVLARDLQQPDLRSHVVTAGFPSSLRNYKALISSHEELPGHITCETADHENSVERLPTTPTYSNHLYGSTPERRTSFGRPAGRALDVFKTDPRSVNRLDEHAVNRNARTRAEEDYVGPAMELVYAWSTVDFEYDSVEARDSAIFDGGYVPENNLPLGLEVWRDKVFITLPKWKDGIPATLATVPKDSKTKSPKLKPYPSWEWHHPENCEALTSVFRVQVDECDRLWVLDSGKVGVTKEPTQLCPPALYVFDLTMDTLLRKYNFPEDQVKEDSLFTNVIVDIRNHECGTARAYMSDVFRYGLVVYDLHADSSFRVEHHYFYPDPLASRYELHGMKFQWTDGIFGIALSPVDVHQDRTLFFHPMSSFREFAVSTSLLRDKRTAEKNTEMFTPIGRPRAKDYGHSSGSAVDRDGVMFFNMVTRDSVWCWDTRKEYIPQNLGVVGASNLSLVFPNDIKIDQDYEQNVWLISNRLPMYLYGGLDSSKINYRVYRANAKAAVKDTVCDPNYRVANTEQVYDDSC